MIQVAERTSPKKSGIRARQVAWKQRRKVESWWNVTIQNRDFVGNIIGNNRVITCYNTYNEIFTSYNQKLGDTPWYTQNGGWSSSHFHGYLYTASNMFGFPFPWHGMPNFKPYTMSCNQWQPGTHRNLKKWLFHSDNDMYCRFPT